MIFSFHVQVNQIVMPWKIKFGINDLLLKMNVIAKDIMKINMGMKLTEKSKRLKNLSQLMKSVFVVDKVLAAILKEPLIYTMKPRETRPPLLF